MMDLVLEAWVSFLIEISKLRGADGTNHHWEPGRKLKLLFAAYNGARNTGEDVRVEEMLRQVRRVLGEEKVQPSVLTFDPKLSRGYFGDAAQIKFPNIFPPFLYSEIPRHDGVVACLGSMFQRTFANATAAFMIGTVGIASARQKISVAYGGEAGRMDHVLSGMCRRYCQHSLLIMRNEESCVALQELGLPSELGTDTAWTFEPHPPQYGREKLRRAGWNEKDPVLVVCPNNPFWWPVNASAAKYFARTLTGAYKESQYRSVYFHTTGAKADAGFRRYVTSIANAIRAYRTRHKDKVFPVFVGMEQLDQRACQAASERLGGVPVFTSADHDMYQLVSIVRCAHLLVSSRYHGIVTSMPALIPSAGVTMDERIRNLMRERGHQNLLVEADDPELEGRLLKILEILGHDGEAISDAIGRTVVKNVKVMARMGESLERCVHERYPGFPVRAAKRNWEEYLPVLPANLRHLVERYEMN